MQYMAGAQWRGDVPKNDVIGLIDTSDDLVVEYSKVDRRLFEVKERGQSKHADSIMDNGSLYYMSVGSICSKKSEKWAED